MTRHPTAGLIASTLLVGVCSMVELRSQRSQPSGAGAYQVVKVCSLVPLAEVKKLTPWPPHLDASAKAEENAIGTQGSSCEYPNVHVQVRAFRPQALDAARKSRKPEPVTGIGDEAFVHNGKDLFAELYAKVGPHLLTILLDIGPKKTFESVKPSLIELGKTFAARLR